MQIRLEHVDYTYDEKTAFEQRALFDISFSVDKGEFVGLIGHTGSGKSTLIQLLNGLLKPNAGTVYYEDEDIHGKGYSLKILRQRVGVVFQYPEYQLFEVTVLDDVMFGPKNAGLNKEEAEKAAREALSMVGLKEELYGVSPIELSGGEKRRAAIAGILAMQPEVLILDEPTAGLDPKGRDDILQLIADLHDKKQITVILVSHSMNDVARYVDRLIVMNEGRIYADGKTADIFKQYKELEKIGLSAPASVYILNALKEAGYDVDTDLITPEQAAEEICNKIFAN